MKLCHFYYFCSIFQIFFLTWCKNSLCFDCILQNLSFVTGIFLIRIFAFCMRLVNFISFQSNIGPPTSNQTLYLIFNLMYISLLFVSIANSCFVFTREHRSLVPGAFLLIFPPTVYHLSFRQ